MAKQSPLEREFMTQLLRIAPDLLPIEPQYRAVAWFVGGPGKGLRKRMAKAGLEHDWRSDFAWPDPIKVAVEIDGGTRTNGRHNRHAGFHADCNKLNWLAEQGWIVLRYTSQHVKDDPQAMFNQIRRVIELRHAGQYQDDMVSPH